MSSQSDLDKTPTEDDKKTPSKNEKIIPKNLTEQFDEMSLEDKTKLTALKLSPGPKFPRSLTPFNNLPPAKNPYENINPYKRLDREMSDDQDGYRNFYRVQKLIHKMDSFTGKRDHFDRFVSQVKSNMSQLTSQDADAIKQLLEQIINFKLEPAVFSILKNKDNSTIEKFINNLHAYTFKSLSVNCLMDKLNAVKISNNESVSNYAENLKRKGNELINAYLYEDVEKSEAERITERHLKKVFIRGLGSGQRALCVQSGLKSIDEFVNLLEKTEHLFKENDDESSQNFRDDSRRASNNFGRRERSKTPTRPDSRFPSHTNFFQQSRRFPSYSQVLRNNGNFNPRNFNRVSNQIPRFQRNKFGGTPFNRNVANQGLFRNINYSSPHFFNNNAHESFSNNHSQNRQRNFTNENTSAVTRSPSFSTNGENYNNRSQSPMRERNSRYTVSANHQSFPNENRANDNSLPQRVRFNVPQ